MALRKQTILTPQSDDDGFAQSQSPAAGGTQSLTLNGVLAGTSLNQGHLITVTSGGNDTGRTFVVTGTDYRGVTITNSFAGASGGVASSTKYFKTVTSVTIDGNSAGTVKVGVNGASASGWVLLDHFKNPFAISLAVDISGTTTYTVQHTFDDLQLLTDISSVKVFSHVEMAAKTADGDGNYAFPCTATRVIITSYTSGTTTFTVTQAG